MLLILTEVPELSVSCPTHTKEHGGAPQLSKPQNPPALLLLGLHKNPYPVEILSPQPRMHDSRGYPNAPVRDRRAHSSPRAVAGHP